MDVVAGAHGAGEQVDGVGQLLFEFAEPAGADAQDVEKRQASETGGHDEAQQNVGDAEKVEHQL